MYLAFGPALSIFSVLLLIVLQFSIWSILCIHCESKTYTTVLQTSRNPFPTMNITRMLDLQDILDLALLYFALIFVKRLLS